MGKKSVFDKALYNFTMDMACGDAIRALTDRGYTPLQIKETLTFPAPMDHIAKIMWDRLVATRKILPAGTKSSADAKISAADALADISRDYEMVERRDEYGRRSFLRVKKESSEETLISPEDYILFDPNDHQQREDLKDNDFISALPWPKGPVWIHRSLTGHS